MIIIIGIFVCYFCFIYYETRNRKEIAQILGIKEVVIVSSDYTFYPYISLRDGDTMEVYQLSSSTIGDFLSYSCGLNDAFYESQKWTKENWHKTPIDSIKWKQELATAFAPRIGANKKFNLLVQENIKLLCSPNAYYAFYSKSNDIVFFVLDVINKKLYIMTAYT